MSVSIYFLIAGAVMLFSFALRAKLKSTYAKWGRTRNTAGITGGQTARLILDNNGIRDVRLEAARGRRLLGRPLPR